MNPIFCDEIFGVIKTEVFTAMLVYLGGYTKMAAPYIFTKNV